LGSNLIMLRCVPVYFRHQTEKCFKRKTMHWAITIHFLMCPDFMDTTIMSLDNIHHLVEVLKQHFGDWTLSPSSGKNLLCGVQSTELAPISGQPCQW
jgi:hypothetical protein